MIPWRKALFSIINHQKASKTSMPHPISRRNKEVDQKVEVQAVTIKPTHELRVFCDESQRIVVALREITKHNDEDYQKLIQQMRCTQQTGSEGLKLATTGSTDAARK